jgi:hypothetical protein
MADLPDEYPTDETLLAESELVASGADIHDRNKYRSGYRRCVAAYKSGRNEVERRSSWKYCVDYERLLRGVVAEAKAGRNYGHRFDVPSI